MFLARTRLWEELFELFKNEPWRAILLLAVLALCSVLLHKWIGLGKRQRVRRELTIWNWKRPLWEGHGNRISDEELWNSDGTYGRYVNQDASAPSDSEILWRYHHKRRMKRSRPRSKKRQVHRNSLR